VEHGAARRRARLGKPGPALSPAHAKADKTLAHLAEREIHGAAAAT